MAYLFARYLTVDERREVLAEVEAGGRIAEAVNAVLGVGAYAGPSAAAWSLVSRGRAEPGAVYRFAASLGRASKELRLGAAPEAILGLAEPAPRPRRSRAVDDGWFARMHAVQVAVCAAAHENSEGY